MKRKAPAVASSSHSKRQRGNEESNAAANPSGDIIESSSSNASLSTALVKSLLAIKVKERFPNRIPAILKTLRAIYSAENDVSADTVTTIDGHEEKDVETAIKWSITLLTASKKNIKDDMIAAGFAGAQTKSKAIAITSFLSSAWYHLYKLNLRAFSTDPTVFTSFNPFAVENLVKREAAVVKLEQSTAAFVLKSISIPGLALHSFFNNPDCTFSMMNHSTETRHFNAKWPRNFIRG